MFRRPSLILIALLSIALHATDMVVAVAGHHHGDEQACACSPANEHRHTHAHGGHFHAHSHAHHGHAHSAGDPHCDESCPPARPHSHHHDCAICRHLALTPALVAPPPVVLSAQAAEPICLTANIELPPHRAITQRSRAPPGFPA